MKAVKNTRKICADAINPAVKPLTPEILRTFPGCEHYSGIAAENIIKTLEKLSAVCHRVLKAKEIYTIDNQQVVYLNTQKQPKSKAA